MDNLFKQTRLQFSGVGQDKKPDSASREDLRIPTSKTVSFNLKEKKKDQNWLQRRLSRQMSSDYDSINADEQAIAVAAAAYAISSLNEQGLSDRKKSKTSTVTIKGKKEDTKISIPEYGGVSRKVSEITEVLDDPDSKVAITTASDTKKPEKSLKPASSLRQRSTSFDKQLSSSFKKSSGGSMSELPTSSERVARAQSSADEQPSGSFKRGESTPNLNTPTMVKPAQRPAETKRQSSTRLGAGKSQADIWEETELARIKERYEEQQTTILSWEETKKKTAKHRLDKAERDLERKRAKALEKFHTRIQNIDQVAGGARAKAEEKKRNDELKVKEKANTIRRTGIIPKSTCSCF